jgi:hypothetical protein
MIFGNPGSRAVAITVSLSSFPVSRTIGAWESRSLTLECPSLGGTVVFAELAPGFSIVTSGVIILCRRSLILPRLTAKFIDAEISR